MCVCDHDVMIQMMGSETADHFKQFISSLRSSPQWGLSPAGLCESGFM